MKPAKAGFPDTLIESLFGVVQCMVQSSRVRPRIMAHFEDIALLSICGQYGHGFFAGYSVIEEEIARDYQVELVGRMPKYRAQFYAIGIERQLKHPAVVAVMEAARARLFA